MSRSVLFVGEDFPGGAVEVVPFSSKRSLLDCDVVLFEPPSVSAARQYQGKPSLDEAESFRMRESCDHWRGEIAEALATGKTVIVFLEPYREFFVDSGNREYSGTGRNQKTTILVEPYDNYRWMPLKLAGMTPAAGKSIKTARDGGVLREYWASFGDSLAYSIYFDDPDVDALLLTKTGGKAVAGARTSGTGGTLVLVPPVDWDWGGFTSVDKKTGRDVWTAAAKKAGHTMLTVTLGIDAALHQSADLTAPPEWADSDEYALEQERLLRVEISALNGEIDMLRERVALKRAEAAEAVRIRSLLFATGRELEAALILALRALGFEADGYQEGDSEFDIIFESPEGRFLGEAEGKDNKAINVDKLRQLDMNIQEDFERDEVKEYARGVLFGNAFRLNAPGERDQAFFTEKCLAGAKRSGVVLIRTTDLFEPARYVLENPKSKTYARSVRVAIARAAGTVVQIPLRPAQANQQPSQCLSTSSASNNAPIRAAAAIGRGGETA